MEVKRENVLEMVYEPRRLQWSWQQIRRNAGAAGIDGMTVDAFERKEEALLQSIHEKLKSGTYVFDLSDGY
jgi:retron-type reverse transcriptase